MKKAMWKWISILILLSMIITIFVGCSSSKNDMPKENSYDMAPQTEKSSDYDADYEAGYEEDYDVVDSESSSVEGKKASIQKIITNASLRLYVKDASGAFNSIKLKVEELGGYIAESYLGEDSGGKIYANLEVKIPADKLNSFLEYIEKIGKIKNKNTTTQDITEEYYDINSRLSHAKKQEKQLLDVMNKAETIEEILQVQHALDGVQERIEQLQGKINLWDQLVSLSTVQIYVENESGLVSDREDDTKVISFKEIGTGIKNGLISTSKFTVNALGYLIITFFYLLIPGSVVLGLVLIIILIFKKKDKRKTDKMNKINKANNEDEQDF